ncbi:MAG: hypothetical protein LBP22_02780 [Deltaproteobacteria bacterium]|jgi:hypothetical protein|nr:hypothetical protein [Deltaproteobacteria bacterium]
MRNPSAGAAPVSPGVPAKLACPNAGKFFRRECFVRQEFPDKPAEAGFRPAVIKFPGPEEEYSAEEAADSGPPVKGKTAVSFPDML